MSSHNSVGLQLRSQDCFDYPLRVFGESSPTCFSLQRILSSHYQMTDISKYFYLSVFLSQKSTMHCINKF